MKNSRKVCFYVMTADSGFAPNPFHDWCTLAACTPNHCYNHDEDRGPAKNLGYRDLIAGCCRSGPTAKVIYVMEVAEVLGLKKYRQDDRFALKKPDKNGTWEDQVGDNIYCKDTTGQWHRDENAKFHPVDSDEWKKDIRGNRVFVGRRFVYFGRKAVELPAKVIPCLPARRGIKYLREDGDPDLFNRFLKWAFNRRRLGRLGMPKDMRTQASCGCKRDVCLP